MDVDHGSATATATTAQSASCIIGMPLLRAGMRKGIWEPPSTFDRPTVRPT